MKKIWFNRWFSTAYHFIEAIKNNLDNQEFQIYGTHPDNNAVYLQLCDVVETEPELSGKEYVEYCLSFCKENNIDVFIPRKGMVDIAAYIEEFQMIGTKVLVCPDAELMTKIDNKALMYEELKGKDIVAIPEYRVVNNVQDFELAVKQLQELGIRVCFKPVHGEGGNGFRVIDDRADDIDSLFGSISHKVSLSRAVELLSQREIFPDLMVLEYLDGYEYSIDCLAYEGQLLSAVPRKKAGGRLRELENNQELVEIAQKITETYQIPFIFNIQVKYKDGIPKLLEINPRMSGGLHITCLSGVNYPYEAVKLLLEGNPTVFHPNFDIKASHVEKECIIKDKTLVLN